VRVEFAYDGGGPGKGGDVTLYVDGAQVGEGRVDATAAMIFSADDTCDVGREGGALVSPEYGRENHFSGEIEWVQIDVDESAQDQDHLISPAERMHIAMARQ
jgi:arylsulfatase